MMKKKLLEEIKKISYYNNYQTSQTLSENKILLKENPGNLTLKLLDNLSGLAGKKFVWTNIAFSSKAIPTGAEILKSFRDSFSKSGAYTKLEKKLGSGAADDLILKFYQKNGDLSKLSTKEFVDLIESLGEHSLGALTVREVFGNTVKTHPTMEFVVRLMKKEDDLAQRLALKDGNEALSRWSDDFLDAALGTDFKGARAALKDVPVVNPKVIDDVTPPKTTTKTKKFWKGVKAKFSKWFTRGSKGYKSRLMGAVTWSVDKFFIYFGTATILAIFKGPLLGLLSTFLIGRLFSKIGKAFKLDKIFTKQSTPAGRQLLDDGTLTSWMDQGISFLRLPTKMEAGMGGLAISTGLSRGYWMTLTAIGLFYNLFIAGNQYVEKAIEYIHGLVPGGIDLMDSGVWTKNNVTAALTGGLYNSIGGAEGVKNLGLEFDETVLDESADMLNDMLSYWEGLPGPMGTGIGEGVGITQDDVEKAEAMLLEWFENCPSLLFISAVSGRMEEKHGKNLLQSINDYEVWAETLLVTLDFTDGDWTRSINLKNIIDAVQGMPLFQRELDDFIVELYDSVTTGRDSQIVLSAIQDMELSVDEKKDLLRAAISPTIELLNKQLSPENKTSFNEMLQNWDGEEAVFNFSAGQIDDLLKIQKVANMAPVEGSLYWVEEGGTWLIATKNTKNVNNSIVEVKATRQKLDLEDLVGSNGSFNQNDIDTSFPKGVIYYVGQYGKRGYKVKDFCEALEEKMGWSDDKFKGKCRGKHFKQMPILKTIAATQMSELTRDKKIALSTRKKSLEDMFNQEFGDLESTVDDLKDRIEENKIIGLESILLESRKN